MGVQIDVKDDTLAKWSERVMGGVVALVLWLAKKVFIGSWKYYSEHKDIDMTIKLKYFIGFGFMSAIAAVALFIIVERVAQLFQ